MEDNNGLFFSNGPAAAFANGPAEEAAVEWHGVEWPQVIAFALCWEVVYQALNCYCARRYAHHPKIFEMGGSYATAFLNALVCSVAGLFAVVTLLDASEPARALMQPTSVPQPLAGNVILLATDCFLGWLLFDVFHILAWFPTLGGPDMLLHHVVYILLSILGSGFRIAPFVVGWLMSGEVSSMFLNTRWLLINSGRGDSRALKRVEYAFAATFFVFRVVIFWGGMHQVLNHELPFLLAPPMSAPRWALNTLCGFVVCGAVLNLFWFFKIVRMALRSGPPPSKHGGKMSDVGTLSSTSCLSSPRRESSIGDTASVISECDSISIT